MKASKINSKKSVWGKVRDAVSRGRFSSLLKRQASIKKSSIIDNDTGGFVYNEEEETAGQPRKSSKGKEKKKAMSEAETVQKIVESCLNSRIKKEKEIEVCEHTEM